MTGKRSLNGNLNGFQVTYFTNHYDIRVLAQYRTQPLRKGHIGLQVYLSLSNTRKTVLYRIFYSQDVATGIVKVAECSVQRRGLTRARGASHQNNAVRLADDVTHRLKITGRHAKLTKTQSSCLLIQQTHNYTFAMT